MFSRTIVFFSYNYVFHYISDQTVFQIVPLANEYNMASIKTVCQTCLIEMLKNRECTLKSQVDILVLAEKYQGLEKVLPIASELLYHNSLSVLKELDGYEAIKRNGFTFEKRLGMIENGKNYKHHCFFEQCLKEWKIRSDKILCKLYHVKNAWRADEYRCKKEHWFFGEFLSSPAARCTDCIKSIQKGIEECCFSMHEDLNIQNEEKLTETGE